MAYEIPKTSFEPHPEGEHTGAITEVVDQGLRETRYGTKHKLTAIIESDTATQDSGEPFQLWVWFTLTGGPKSTLVQLRQKLLRRALTEEERTHFDPDTEMVGRKVRYLVVHNYGDDGQVFANLITWSPLEPGQAARQARERCRRDRQPRLPRVSPRRGKRKRSPSWPARRTIYPFEFEIGSHTRAGVQYRVWRPAGRSWQCECPGFHRWRRPCRHIRQVQQLERLARNRYGCG